jgi:hypothetical protein
MGGATVIHYVAKYKAAHVAKLALFGAAAPLWTKRSDFNYGLWTKEDVTGLITLNNTNRPLLFETFSKYFRPTKPVFLPVTVPGWVPYKRRLHHMRWVRY